VTSLRAVSSAGVDTMTSTRRRHGQVDAAVTAGLCRHSCTATQSDGRPPARDADAAAAAARHSSSVQQPTPAPSPAADDVRRMSGQSWTQVDERQRPAVVLLHTQHTCTQYQPVNIDNQPVCTLYTPSNM